MTRELHERDMSSIFLRRDLQPVRGVVRECCGEAQMHSDCLPYYYASLLNFPIYEIRVGFLCVDSCRYMFPP